MFWDFSFIGNVIFLICSWTFAPHRRNRWNKMGNKFLMMQLNMIKKWSHQYINILY